MENTSYVSCLMTILVATSLSAIAEGKHNNIVDDEISLLALRAHITSDPHDVLTGNWAPNTSVCSWTGVYCDARHKRVKRLNLSNLGLGGTIPSQIGNLSFLTYFNISFNNFYGDLPSELGYLRRLKILDFGSNNFNGELPWWLGIFPKLNYLALANNKITGSLPSSLYNISTLEYLDLANNSMEGNISSEIGKLVKLKFLMLTYNKLAGLIPMTIFNISSLEHLHISNTTLSGSLPEDMCLGLPKLQYLRLSWNELYGQIPSTIGQCGRLKDLSLAKNKFTGLIPKEIGNLTMLQSLSLAGNRLEGTIPSEIWSRLPLLEVLLLHSNNLKGSLPREIGNCSTLRVIDLSENNLTGLLPNEIGNLHKLEFLASDINNLHGPIPGALFNCSKLSTISLVQNQLSSNLPSDVGLWLPNFEWLSLRGNDLDGTVPNSISNASKLTILSLSQNKFTGSFPHWIKDLGDLEVLGLASNGFTDPDLNFLNLVANCRKLKFLWIQENSLDGILPKTIGNLSTSLEELDASYCGIQGSIPNEIGNLSSLIFLNLAGNDLTGAVPFVIKGLWKLQKLVLQRNRLEGFILAELCSLKNLGELELSQNELSGPIPTCLGNLTSLRYLYLGSNRLASPIPTSLWSLTYILELDLSSNLFGGMVPPGIGNLKVVGTLNLSSNNFSGEIPSTITTLQNLVNFSLAYNRLQGSIPNTISEMVSLEFLDLSHNDLSGVIPKSLEKLLYLKLFNVSYNRLKGEVPSAGSFANFSGQFFMSNEALCGSPHLQLPPCHTTHQRSRKKFVALVLCICLLIGFMLLILTFLIDQIKRRERNGSFSRADLSLEIISQRRITYEELLRATNGFEESNLLGMGSFARVYKGRLEDGSTLAVKVFNLQSQGALKSFDVECEVLRNIRHRNLIQVITSCSNLDFKALVLKCIPNGSLEKWLYSHNYFLDILQRLSIMIDVACVLEYLHHDYTTTVAHCDVKPSNVLFDEDMVAHLSDFGIAKYLGQEESIAQTKTLGTLGYMAPEYGMDGLVSTRCDVYSYGIMLLETFTRVQPTDERFAGEFCLKQWVKESFPGTIHQVVDENLIRPENENFVDAALQSITSIMELALNCSAELPDQRINMREVVASLKKIRLRYMSGES